jgi:hypothetical protein
MSVTEETINGRGCSQTGRVAMIWYMQSRRDLSLEKSDLQSDHATEPRGCLYEVKNASGKGTEVATKAGRWS